MTYEVMKYEQGVYYVLQVTPVYNEKHQTHDYKCRGYARGQQVDLAEWVYWALDEAEAYSPETKDYLLRELRPMVRAKLKHLAHLIALQGELIEA